MWPSPVFVKASATSLLSSIVLFGQSAQLQAKDSFALGGGARHQSSLYQGVDNQQSLLPDFEIKYGRFFLKGKEFGWSVLPEGAGQHTLTSGVSKDLLDGKREDSNKHQLSDVDSGINFKLEWQYKLTAHQSIRLAALHDLADEHSGQQANLSWSYQHHAGRWIVLPELSALWFSKQVKQHYFSLPPELAQDSGSAYSATLKLAYPLSRQWLFNSKLQYQQFTDDLRRSAIVSRNQRHSLYVGLRYYW